MWIAPNKNQTYQIQCEFILGGERERDRERKSEKNISNVI